MNLENNENIEPMTFIKMHKSKNNIVISIKKIIKRKILCNINEENMKLQDNKKYLHQYFLRYRNINPLHDVKENIREVVYL